jgi:hypothetical protein
MHIEEGVEVKRVFIGAGCNRIVNNVSWGASGFVSFGASNAVAIFNPKVTPFHSSFIFNFCFLSLNSFFFPADCSNFDHSSWSQSCCQLHSLAPK